MFHKRDAETDEGQSREQLCPGLSKVVKDALFTLIAEAQPERN